MKKFVPGEIARAEDVNSNFAELKDGLDRLLGGIQIGQVAVGSIQPGDQTNSYTVQFPKPFKKPPMVFMQSEIEPRRMGHHRHGLYVDGTQQHERHERICTAHVGSNRTLTNGASCQHKLSHSASTG